jgi:type II secretory pathway pseudopilin PulG
MKSKIAQVWIETVIYTLIGLSILGLLIAVATPKINQMVDKSTLVNSFDSLNTLNEQIRDTMTAAGNQREILLTVKKGEYNIDGNRSFFSFVLKNSNFKYSEIGVTFKQGDINVLTTDRGNKKYDVLFFLNYSSFNITYDNKNILKQLTASPNGYNLIIQNKGNNQINFETR